MQLCLKLTAVSLTRGDQKGPLSSQHQALFNSFATGKPKSCCFKPSSEF